MKKILAATLSALVIFASDAMTQSHEFKPIETRKIEFKLFKARKTANDRAQDISSRLGMALPEEVMFAVKEYFNIVQELPKLRRLLDSYTSYDIIKNEDFLAKVYINNIGRMNRFKDYGIYLRMTYSDGPLESKR